MKTLEVKIIEIEGDVIKTSNDKIFNIYKREANKYYKKQKQLTDSAYPKTTKAVKKDAFAFFNMSEKPKFDVEKKLKSLGYQLIVDYKKTPYFIIKTPYAEIRRYRIKEKMDFISTDGALIANILIKIILK